MANLTIRTKLLLAGLPLVVMVILATLYSSTESKRIDASYSDLIDHDVKTLQSLSVARAHSNRIGLFLYEEITEPDPDKKGADRWRVRQDLRRFRSPNRGSIRQSPDHAPEIKTFSALFDKAVSDARPVRAAALAGNSRKGHESIAWGRGGGIGKSRGSRPSTWWMKLRMSVDQQSDDLTRQSSSHHSDHMVGRRPRSRGILGIHPISSRLKLLRSC